MVLNKNKSLRVALRCWPMRISLQPNSATCLSFVLRVGRFSTYEVTGPNYTGLSGRYLTSVSGNPDMFGRRYMSRQYSMVLDTTIEASTIRDKLPEIELQLLQPLYELFNFFKLPMSLVQEEIARMTSGRF